MPDRISLGPKELSLQDKKPDQSNHVHHLSKCHSRCMSSNPSVQMSHLIAGLANLPCRKDIARTHRDKMEGHVYSYSQSPLSSCRASAFLSAAVRRQAPA